MRAEPERHMPVRRAHEVDRVGILERGGIEAGGREHQDRLVTPLQRLAVEHGIAGDGAVEPEERAVVAQELLGRRGIKHRLVDQPLTQVRALVELTKHVAGEPGGRVHAAQQHEEARSSRSCSSVSASPSPAARRMSLNRSSPEVCAAGDDLGADVGEDVRDAPSTAYGIGVLGAVVDAACTHSIHSGQRSGSQPSISRMQPGGSAVNNSWLICTDPLDERVDQLSAELADPRLEALAPPGRTNESDDAAELLHDRTVDVDRDQRPRVAGRAARPSGPARTVDRS